MRRTVTARTRAPGPTRSPALFATGPGSGTPDPRPHPHPGPELSGARAGWGWGSESLARVLARASPPICRGSGSIPGAHPHPPGRLAGDRGSSAESGGPSPSESPICQNQGSS
jgi:hypothetical protein